MEYWRDMGYITIQVILLLPNFTDISNCAVMFFFENFGAIIENI